jgi:hypothetical protein
MSWHALPHGDFVAFHVAPASREMATAGMLQLLDHEMFWLMTATSFGSKGLAETAGSVPPFTLTSESTRGVGVGEGEGVGEGVGVAVGEGVASVVGPSVGSAVAVLVTEARFGDAEGVEGLAAAEKDPAALHSPNDARTTHAAIRTAIATQERRLSDTFGRPRG